MKIAALNTVLHAKMDYFREYNTLDTQDENRKGSPKGTQMIPKGVPKGVPNGCEKSLDAKIQIRRLVIFGQKSLI